MLKLIETFSGIGAQAQALKNLNVDYKTVTTVDWEIGAIYAYDIIHNGEQDLSEYRHHNKESLIESVGRFNLSGDGKKALSDKALQAMSTIQLKKILAAINRTKNLVDITQVHASDLPEGDILTYSFPCQDLSAGRYWHHYTGGIDRDANNRSTLLWQIERILKEYKMLAKPMPRFLLMENVSDILSSKNIDNFREWQRFLEKMGYVNKVSTLDARNFGIPQSRVRTYMLSVRADSETQADYIDEYLMDNDLEMIALPDEKIRKIGEFLRLDYSNPIYRQEAVDSTPNYTTSREKIYHNSRTLAIDDKPQDNVFARTVTTKQDRDPNSGIIKYKKNRIASWKNDYYRNLTPRECFLLMGFEEKDFDNLEAQNDVVRKGQKMLPQSKLIKLAGNSIVVPVLEEIFKQVVELNHQLD